METASALKVRLVRCPKCRLLLPEPANCFVYKCGGCSTVLQAKNRKKEAAQMNESDHVSEVKDSISSHQKASLSSLSERSLDQSIGRDQDISSDCTSEKFGGAKSSNEDQNDESYHNESQDCDIDQPSDKFCSSTELACRGNENSSQSNGANSEVEVNDESSHLAEAKSPVDVINESDPISQSSNTETSVLARGSNSVAVNDESSHLAEANSPVDVIDESDPLSKSSNTEISVVAGGSNSVAVNDESSHLAEAKSPVDVINESDPISKNSNTETSVVARGSNSVEVNDESLHVAEAKSPVDVIDESDPISKSSNTETSVVVGESISSDVLMSSPEEQPKQLQHVRSNDAFGANSEVEVCDDSSQFVEDKLPVDINDASDSTSRSLNTENSAVVTGENNSTVAYHKPAGESDSSDVLISSPDEQPEQLRTNFKHGYDRVRSNDAFEANSEVEVNDQSSHLAEAKLEVDISNESDSTSRSSNAEDAVVKRETNSAVTSHRPAGESVSSDILISSPDEQPKQLPTNFDLVRSNDAFGANSEEVNDQSSQLVEAKTAVDVNNDNDNFRSLNTENTKVTSNVTSHRLAGERVSSSILMSSPDEQPKPRLWTSFKHGFDRVRSNDTFDSTSFFSPSSELSTIDYVTKSPTIRSAHAYDGSVSSFDGIDDQFLDQHMNSYGNPNKFVSSEERTRRDKFPANGNPEMRHQMRNLSSVLSDKRHYAMNDRKWDRDELLDSTRHDYAVRNATRFERDEFQSPAHLYPRDYRAGYESGSTSSQLHDEFRNHSSEQEKIRLLRMVYELQDQLNRTGYVSDKASYQGSSELNAKEKYAPPYYSREITEEELSRELNYCRYPERFRPGSSWSHQYEYSGIPFSGEVTNNRHCIDSSCLHCCPQDWQYSTQLPPPIRPQSRGFCTLHPVHSYYSSHRSCPTSPRQFTDSEFPICYREAKSDDQRREEYHVKRHTKEQPHLVKRQLRPSAGGAPFIICYCCLKLLQLPADFLLFKRRFHQLKCGACSKVLKFSLENRIHIVPYTPKAEAPRQNEIVDYRDAVHRRNSISSHDNDYPQADPVSCSDDYGLSHCKSYSTDENPVYVTPFQNIQQNADAGNKSYDSHKSMKEGNRFVPKQSQNKNKSPVQTYESAETSSRKSRSGKVSSEIKEMPVKSGSPLHWLMGYNSPSQVLRGSDPSSSGTSSFYT